MLDKKALIHAQEIARKDCKDQVEKPPSETTKSTNSKRVSAPMNSSMGKFLGQQAGTGAAKKGPGGFVFQKKAKPTFSNKRK